MTLSLPKKQRWHCTLFISLDTRERARIWMLQLQCVNMCKLIDNTVSLLYNLKNINITYLIKLYELIQVIYEQTWNTAWSIIEYL